MISLLQFQLGEQCLTQKEFNKYSICYVNECYFGRQYLLLLYPSCFRELEIGGNSLSSNLHSSFGPETLAKGPGQALWEWGSPRKLMRSHGHRGEGEEKELQEVLPHFCFAFAAPFATYLALYLGLRASCGKETGDHAGCIPRQGPSGSCL